MHRALLALSAVLGLAVAVAGCGGGDDESAPRVTTPSVPSVTLPEPTGEGLAIGLTENNPHLLGARGPAPEGFEPWRARVHAMRPALYRLVIDWATLQPDPGRPADLARQADGCMRGAPPCAPYAGVRDVLRAIAGQQRAGDRFGTMVVFYGVPEWAAARPKGCERDNIEPRSRPINDRGLAAFRKLVRQLMALARREGAQLTWWSPWNEPNGPYFISPQRSRCDPASPPVSVRVYARLARALQAELEAAPGRQRLVIGELAGVVKAGPRGSGVPEFFRALPEDVLCAADVIAQHQYAELPGETKPDDPVGALQQVLRERRCARDTPIWITEAGVGAPHAGDDRPTGARALRRQCIAWHEQLRGWHADPQIAAAFQYTAREDPAFPVGLFDAQLTKAYSNYDLLLAWSGNRTPGDPPPELPGSCRG